MKNLIDIKKNELTNYLIPDLVNIIAEYENDHWINVFDICVREMNIKILHCNFMINKFHPSHDRYKFGFMAKSIKYKFYKKYDDLDDERIEGLCEWASYEHYVLLGTIKEKVRNKKKL